MVRKEKTIGPWLGYSPEDTGKTTPIPVGTAVRTVTQVARGLYRWEIIVRRPGQTPVVLQKGTGRSREVAAKRADDWYRAGPGGLNETR